MEKNKKNIRKLEKLKMKGLKTPSFIILFTGKIHARQNKVIQEEDGKILSTWFERKQKDFNSYSAMMLKITGDILLSFRTELAKKIYIQNQNTDKLITMKEEVENMYPISVKEKRIEGNLKKAIIEIQDICNEDNEIIKTLQLAISELEHRSLQLIQRTKEQAESKMLIYLQGAKILVNKVELIEESTKEIKLYIQYCTYEDEVMEREIE